MKLYKNKKSNIHRHGLSAAFDIKKGQKISGHVCQGHVDFCSKVKKIKLIDKAYLIEFSTNNSQKKN